MSGIRYTISGLTLFFIFKIYSLEIFDKKGKQTVSIETSTNQRKKKRPDLLQIIIVENNGKMQ